MMRETKTFGSYGRRDDHKTPAELGRLLFLSGAQARGERVFGRRSSTPGFTISFAAERLRTLHSELLLVFQDMAYPDGSLPFAYGGDEEEPYVHILPEGYVRLDLETGHYIFSDETPGAASVVVTGSHERLIDFVITYLSSVGAEQGSEARLDAIEKCVGLSVSTLERALILATVRHCLGNRTHAARLLGISLRTLRNKLGAYMRAPLNEGKPAYRASIEKPPEDPA